uniref:Major facilitator superfamily (MFS) profile domain-containing protein n=1 Tax=Octactis speculum TaxID=3111310 RepID=A0A7S2HHT2_9STRA|mmetsp:Transcript_65027/g.89365  ORF Transcript_65027/g.89365 Transcript_65027/m.89365 type:complete len:501 (+) Transcript_65027:66-1568(+)
MFGLDDPIIKLSAILGSNAVQHKNKKQDELKSADIEDSCHDNAEHRVYNARWVTLALTSGSYFLSSWISYTIPTDDDILIKYFGVTEGALTYALAYFLLGNSIGTFVEPYIESSLGLRKLYIFSASLLVLGMFWSVSAKHAFYGERIGMSIVGMSQGIVQCPLAKICAIWFCPNGRTKATTIALTMNNFGIGIAYVVPGLYWDGTIGFTRLREMLLGFSCLILVFTCLFMEESPPVAPSISAELMQREMKERPHSSNPIEFLFGFWWNAFSLFRVKGFFSIISISIGDVIVAYLTTVFLTETLQADYEDNDFLRTMVGIGYYVPSVFVASAAASLIDHFKTKHAEATYLTSLHSGCIMTIFSCGMILMALYNSPEDSARNSFILYMVMLGNLMALLDGISADGAVEICYDCGFDGGHGIENMVIALQMFLGNAISGLLMVGVPSNLMQSWLAPEYMAVYVISTVVAVFMYIPLIGFRGKFKRVKMDMKIAPSGSTQRLLA